MTILGILALLGFLLTSTSTAGKIISNDPKWRENQRIKKEKRK